MSEAVKPLSRHPTPFEIARHLKPFSSDALVAELRRRGEFVCQGDGCEDLMEDDGFRRGPAEEARYALGRDDLDEAVIQIARAHEDFARLPHVLAARLAKGAR